jgi:hypothetical protein
MARGKPNRGRKLSEISRTIIAEWYRVVGTDKEMDTFSLTAAFNDILAPVEIAPGEQVRFIAVIDQDGDRKRPFKIIVPLPPKATKEELDEYLKANGDFEEGFGTAVLFGCGH